MLTVALWTVLACGAGYLVYEAFDSDDSNDDDAGEDIVGTEGDDTLEGGSGDDVLSGLAGDDDLLGNGGDDTLRGNEGSDIGLGGDGDDVLRGALDVDFLLGEAGDDYVNGNSDGDWVEGGTGDDTVLGDAGDDLVIGGEGSDSIQGGGGDDELFGGDVLSRSLTQEEIDPIRTAIAAGESFAFPSDITIGATDDGAADTLDGGRGDDFLAVGDGDIATGGTGEDVFYLLDGDETVAAEITDFDPDEDTLFYVYDEGTTAPTLELTTNEDGTQTLTADGVQVAVITSSAALNVSDITLYESGSDADVPI